MNFRLKSMMEYSDPGMVVVGLVRSCIARFVCLVK